MTKGLSLVLLLTALAVAPARAQDPRLQRDVDARRVEMLKSVVLTPYQQSVKPGAEQTGEVSRLIETTLWHVQRGALDWWSGTREVHDRAAARELARKVFQAGESNPHALFAAAWILTDPTLEEDDPDGGAALEKALAANEQAQTHPLVRYLLAQRCRYSMRRMRLGDMKLRERLDAQWPLLAVEAIESGVFGEANRDVQAALIQDWDDDVPEYVPPQHFLEALDGSAKVGGWFKALARGRHEVTYAWVERGSRWAAETTPAQFAAFHARLDRAAAALEEAWRLAPDEASAAAEMIRVEMGRGNDDARSEWLRRAMDVQFDHVFAWNMYLTSALPRWGGSPEEVLAVGRMAANIERYDTRVPWYLISALRTLAYDAPRALGNPEIYGMVRRVCQGYRKQMPPGMPPAMPDSIETAFAYKAGDWKRATELFAAASAGGRSLEPDPFLWVGVDIDLARIKSAALASPEAGDLIERAVALDERGNRDVALEQLNRAAAALTAAPASNGPDAHRYVRFRIERLKFMAALEEGKSAPLLVPGGNDLWLADTGNFQPQPDGSLRLDQEFPPLRMAFRLPLPQNFVLRGTIDLKAAKPVGLPSIHVLLGANFYNPARHACSIAFFPLTRTVRVDAGGPAVQSKVEFGDRLDFEISVHGDRLSLTVNEQAVLRDHALPDVDRRGTVGLWVYNWHGRFPASITVRDLTMQQPGAVPAAPPAAAAP